MASRSLLRGGSAVAAGAVLTALLTMLAAPATATSHSVQATYYAAPNGSGSDCTSASPCSLDGARDKVRTVNGSMTGDIVVKLKDGTYERGTTSFTLTENTTVHDSGTNGYDVIYQADTGAQPLISGGKTVTGFTEIDTTKHIWVADVGESVESRELYVDGVRATRARSAGNPAMTPTSTGYTLPTTGPYAAMNTWGNPSDIEVVGYGSWKRVRYSVDSISATAIDMDDAGWNDGYTQPSTAVRTMAYIENAYELLDSPGEWYLNRATDKLYYIPLAGQSVTGSTFVLGRTEKLVNASGTSTTPLHNVQFDGLAFSYDGWTDPNTAYGYPDFQAGAVYRGTPPPGTVEPWSENNYKTPAGVSFSMAQNIVVRNSTFTHMANAGLGFGPGSQFNVIDHNTFSDIGGNGIDLGGITKADHHPTDPSSIVKYNVISNNEISKVGAQYLDNAAIFLGYTQGSQVKHNTLYDLPYTGISMGWGWGYIDSLGVPVAKNNVVQGNKIYDFMKTVPDGGAIYTLGSQIGSKVVDNYAYGDNNPYSYLYRDNGSAGFLDSNNVIEKTTTINTWYFTNTGSGNYWDAHDNLTQGNYYTAGMGAGAVGSNVVGTNTALSGTWPAGATNVKNQSGVNGTDISSAAEVPISQDKTATASSTWPGYEPAKAVDGDLSTRWARQSGTSDPQWLTVDLGASYTISHVNTSADLYYNRGVKYVIEYSGDNSTWATYADRSAAYTIPGIDTGPSAVTARYLRIRLTDTWGQGASINEFQVFGSPRLISLGKTATASSQYSADYDAAKAVDGFPGTRWAAVDLADPSWVKVDLGANYSISSTTTSAELYGDLPIKYKIEYSTDGTTWTMYADHTAAYAIPGTDTGSVTARYMRITPTDTQNQRASIWEFRVYGS
jgi:hypothetical protein